MKKTLSFVLSCVSAICAGAVTLENGSMQIEFAGEDIPAFRFNDDVCVLKLGPQSVVCIEEDM